MSLVSNNLANYERRHLNYSPTVMFCGAPCTYCKLIKFFKHMLFVKFCPISSAVLRLFYTSCSARRCPWNKKKLFLKINKWFLWGKNFNFFYSLYVIHGVTKQISAYVVYSCLASYRQHNKPNYEHIYKYLFVCMYAGADIRIL